MNYIEFNKNYINYIIDLSQRLNKCYNLFQKTKKNSSVIYKVLKKYLIFKLDIMEYCDPSFCFNLREEYYLNNFNSVYNILKIVRYFRI